MPDAVRASYLRVLVALAEFYVLVRPQLQLLAFPTHKQSRFTRKILGDLVRAGFVGKTRRTITYDATRAGCPVYFLPPEGREKLCEWTGDEFYLAASVARPRDDRLEHWIAIAEWRLRLSAALARQDAVSMPLWVNEWNKLRTDGVGDYYLHTQFGGDKKLSCSPDLGFTLAMQGVSVPNYGEADLGSSSVEQVIARKHQGYHLMQANDQWRERHFPGVAADKFRVLVLTTSRWRRDRMAKLIADKPSADRWRIACWDDFRAETLLHEAIWIDARGSFLPLATPPEDYQPLAESYAIVKRTVNAVSATNESENLEEARS